MIKVPELHSGYQGYLWITNAMKRFEEVFPGNSDVELSVGLLSAGFHEPPPMGQYGWYGPGNGAARTPYQEENLVLCMEFPCEIPWLNAHTAELNALQSTPSRSGNIHFNFHTRQVTKVKTIDIPMGRFKKPETDQILALMRQANVNLINKDLSNFTEKYGLTWTAELPSQDKLPSPDEQYLYEKYTAQRYINEPSGHVVTLSIQNCDLEANTPALVKLLCSLKVKLQ